VVGEHAIVIQQIHSCHIAQALAQKVMMTFHRDCQVGLNLVGHSMMMMMMMVEPQMKAGHRILVNYAWVV
jgi:hypothetical protein